MVQVTKSLQDPLEVGNSLLGISDNVRECSIEHYQSGRTKVYDSYIVKETILTNSLRLLLRLGASTSSIGSIQAMYSKPGVDHACNINDDMKAGCKEKATSLPDILLVDFNQCEVSV